MALKLKLTSLDGLDEAIKKEYVQRDGAFYLAWEGSDGLVVENVTGLKNALEREKAEKAAAKEKLAKFEGLDPEAARTAFEKYAEIQNWKPDANVEKIWNERAEEIKKKSKKELEDERKRADALERELNDQLVDTALASLVAGKASFKLLLPVVKQNTIIERDAAGRRVVRVRNPETGNARISQRQNNAENMMGLEEYVMDVLRNDPDTAVAFKPSDGGSGAPAGGKQGASGDAGAKEIPRGNALHSNLEDLARGRVKVVD